jgi:hypothetical protein
MGRRVKLQIGEKSVGDPNSAGPHLLLMIRLAFSAQ